MKKELPLQIEGVYDGIYAEFGLRFAALLLDGLIYVPFGIIIMYIESQNLNYYYYTILPNIIAPFLFYIYLPKKYGATPGKMIMKIKIIRLDGNPIGWDEAVRRNIITYTSNLVLITITVLAIGKADQETFDSLSWLQKLKYVQSFLPTLFMLHLWLNYIWMIVDAIVFFTNRQKRALHDFMGKTVVVKSIYIDKIKEATNPEELIEDAI